MTTKRRLLTVCGIVLLSALAQATFAAAQYPPVGRGRNAGGQQFAYENGYRGGLEDGRDEAQRGSNFNYRDNRQYQRADLGYDGRYGSRATYQNSYRQGYAAGYTEGFNNRRGVSGRAVPRGQTPYPSARYPNYPSSGYPNSDPRYRYPDQNRNDGYGSRNPGYDVGFSEGYEKGIEDVRDRDRYDPLRHGWYRDGDHGYNSRYGSREQYKNAYRDGFRQGYDRAFSEGQYNNRNGNNGRRSRMVWPF